MDMQREWRNLRKAQKDLVKQMRAAFGKGYAKQDRPVPLRNWQGRKTQTLVKFFRLV